VIASVAALGAAERPDIYLLIADDLGHGDLGCYGHPALRTPALDRLAAEGTRLEQFYVAAPAGSPSRAALLTGRTPARCRLHGDLGQPEFNRRRDMPDALPPTAPSVARQLGAAGYATAAYGLWQLGEAPAA
jgi:uncharacterized sulfatase